MANPPADGSVDGLAVFVNVVTLAPAGIKGVLGGKDPVYLICVPLAIQVLGTIANEVLVTPITLYS